MTKLAGVGVRTAQMQDADQLLELIHAHAQYERSQASINLPQLQQLLAQAGPLTIIVLTIAHQVIGFAALTFDYSLWRAEKYAHLDCLFVDAKWRAKGLGKLLFQATVNAAFREDVLQLEWQTPSWNIEAIRFYERCNSELLAQKIVCKAGHAEKHRFAIRSA
jgi:GNAT superfamily N-acetyltransferase